MGTYLSTPASEKYKEWGENKDCPVQPIQWAVVDMQGWRKSMEDAHHVLCEFMNMTITTFASRNTRLCNQRFRGLSSTNLAGHGPSSSDDKEASGEEGLYCWIWILEMRSNMATHLATLVE